MSNEKIEAMPKKKFSWKQFWDKVTTGLFILMLSSPVLILLYILLWFINK